MKKLSYLCLILFLSCQSESELYTSPNNQHIANRVVKKISGEGSTSTNNMYHYITLKYLGDYTNYQKNEFRLKEGPKIGLVSWEPCEYEPNIETWLITYNIDPNDPPPTLGHSEDEDEIDKNRIYVEILDFPCNMGF